LTNVRVMFSGSGSKAQTCRQKGPKLADVGETAQFLAMKRLTLNVEGRESSACGEQTLYKLWRDRELRADSGDNAVDRQVSPQEARRLPHPRKEHAAL
jgi:hypothetical protein